MRNRLQLGQIIAGCKILQSELNFNKEVDGVISNGNSKAQNKVFVAIKGLKHDGNEYIEKVLKNGAYAFVTDSEEYYIKYKGRGVLVQNARSALSIMWSNYFGNPSKQMKMIAVTGTNGKTSTAYYIYNILKESNITCGLISTIEIKISNKKLDIEEESYKKISTMTTPDPKELYSILSAMRKAGVQIVVFEASSHSLALNKLDGMEIDIGIFTNLSSEHLDFHKNIDEYFSSKELLFKRCNIGIVNLDDEYGKKLKKLYHSRIFTISCEQNADYVASKIKCNKKGIEYLAQFEKTNIKIKCKNKGKFSVYNTLMAIACANALGIEDKTIRKAILKSSTIKGRLEQYKGKNIYIDYAHTPDATKKVLQTIKEMHPNKKIIALFGCGGDRDKSKRSEIGRICSTYADLSILTSDNSRNESSFEIVKDIVVGFGENKNYIIALNRKDAIKCGVKLLNGKSVLILLGKGHENYEIIGEKQIPFDERRVLNDIYKNDKH